MYNTFNENDTSLNILGINFSGKKFIFCRELYLSNKNLVIFIQIDKKTVIALRKYKKCIWTEVINVASLYLFRLLTCLFLPFARSETSV